MLDMYTSNVGIGAILSQVHQGYQRVIAYYSQALSKPERNYCTTRNAFNIGEVWNLGCCQGNKTFKLILCCTFSRTLVQKLNHFCYKLAEISFFIIFDQKLVEYGVITWLICMF